MKHLALIVLCTQLLCCDTVTTTAPDGTVTVTRTINVPAFNSGAAVVGAFATNSGK